MHNYSNLLVITGSRCLSGCLVGVRSSAFMKKLFPHYPYLLNSHIDHLLMTGLLMVFFLLFSHFRTSSAIIVFSMCIGSLMNPLRFLLLAMKPHVSQPSASPFGMASSFTLTTIGYAGAAWSMAYAGIISL